MKNFILILPVIAGSMWGAAGTFIRVLNTHGIDSWTTFSSRTVAAVLLLFIGIFIYDKSLFRIKIEDLWIFIGAGLLCMLGLNYCFTNAVNQINLSLAAVLLSMSPIFVLFLSRLLFKEAITKKKIYCMLLAITGCVLSSGILEASSGIIWTVTGIFLGLAAAFFYALYGIFSKFSGQRDYNAFTLTFYSLLTLAIAAFPFANWTSYGVYLAEAPVANTLFTFAHGAVASVLPYGFFALALKYKDSGIVSILAAGAEPVSATILGFLFFNENPTFLSITGLVVTITALTLLCKPARRSL
jgi:drug/metabolite transporter (DMT)-like permease